MLQNFLFLKIQNGYVEVSDDGTYGSDEYCLAENHFLRLCSEQETKQTTADKLHKDYPYCKRIYLFSSKIQLFILRPQSC
jgi:hypothetical protein